MKLQRGDIEWTNGWRDDAGCPDKRRWLIIGDSVARDWRGRLQEMVRPINISADFFATSLHIEDPAFFKELQHFISFEEYRYEFIFVNWGGHHGFFRNCSSNPEIYFSYKTHYENLLNYLREVALLKENFAKIIIVSSTPLVLSDALNNFDELKNNEISVRNKIAYDLAIQNKFLYVDHFNLVIENKNIFSYRDGYHFNSYNENIMLAKFLIDELIKNNFITEKGEIVGR